MDFHKANHKRLRNPAAISSRPPEDGALDGVIELHGDSLALLQSRRTRHSPDWSIWGIKSAFLFLLMLIVASVVASRIDVTERVTQEVGEEAPKRDKDWGPPGREEGQQPPALGEGAQEAPKPTPDAVDEVDKPPTKKIYEMALEATDFERDPECDVDWEKVWKEGAALTYELVRCYQAPDTFFNPVTRNMLDSVVVFGGTMELRRPAASDEANFVTYLVTATPEPLLTEEELKSHPLGRYRKEFSPIMAEQVESAIKALMHEQDAPGRSNQSKKVDVDGYGKFFVQRASDSQYSPLLVPSPRARTPRSSRELRKEVSVETPEEAAEEIESFLRTGRGVIVCHLPELVLQVCFNQPEHAEEASPILDEKYPSIDDFRVMLEETISKLVAKPLNLGSYEVLRIMQGPGVPKTTVVSFFGRVK